jgi:hypothetical protein
VNLIASEFVQVAQAWSDYVLANSIFGASEDHNAQTPVVRCLSVTTLLVCYDALPNPFPLKFCEAAQDTQHEPPRGASRVDALTQRRGPYARIRECLNRVYEMGEAAAESIQLPAHDEIEIPAFGVCHELVEGWSAVLCTADARIEYSVACQPRASQ